MRTLVGCLVILAALPASVAAQGSTESASSAPRAIGVSWSPAAPTEGSFAVITLVGPSNATEVEGRLAGEPLHFVAEGEGVFRALAAFPIGSKDTVAIPLTVRGRSGGRRIVTAKVPVARGTFSVDRLTVSPTYGRRPDSATAARIAAETARAVAVYRRSHTTAPLWVKAFQRPLTSRVTSEFGQGREFNGTIRSRHLGVDLDGESGTPVRAANRAVVAIVDEFYYSGNVVYLDHGGGLVTAYMHLRSTEVTPGDTVVAGQVIGRVGATGRVTGPHLHWTARYGRVAVDPLSLVAFDAAELPSGR